MEYKGKPYKSFEDLARKVGLNSSTIRTRMKAGYTLEEAIERGTKEIEYNGNLHTSFEDLANQVGVNSATIRSRMKLGYSLEGAIALGSKEEIQVFHNTFKTLKELTDYYGLDYNHFSVLLSLGKTYEEAVTYMLSKEKIALDGVEYETLTDLCNEYGISGNVVRNRICKGYSLREAVTKPVRQITRSTNYMFRGKIYNTKKELAESYGLQQSFVNDFSKNKKLDYIDSLEVLVTFLDTIKGGRNSYSKSIKIYYFL